MTRRVARGFVALAMAGVLAAAAAAAPAPEVLALVLDEAVPFTIPALPRRGRDLHVDLVRRGDAFEAEGWAWMPDLPAVEHRVRILSAESDEGTLAIELHVDLRHVPPLFTGGTGRVTMDLARDGVDWTGDYRAEFEGLEKREALDLWRSLGGRGAPGWVGGLQDGQTRSITRLPRRHYGSGGTFGQPIVARGRFGPPQGNAPALAARRSRPHLLALPADVASWTGTPARLLAALRESLADHAAGKATPGRPRAPSAFAAAGWAFLHRLDGDDAHAAEAADRARAALTEPAPNGVEPALHEARTLAGLAAAMDLAGQAWPEPLRTRVLEHLGRRIWRLAAPGRPQSIEGGPITVTSDESGPFDLRVGTLRAAAGLAALAILGDPAAEQATLGREPLEACLEVCGRSVRRGLETGFGESGGGTGQHGLADAAEVLYPFLRAWSEATGRDLAAGTGAEHLVVWGLATRGAGLAEARLPHGRWLAAAAGACAVEDRPLVRWAMDAAAGGPVGPWDGMLALLHYPGDVAPRPPAEALPLALADAATGSVVLRSGWDPVRDFVTVFDYAAATPLAAGNRGQFSIHGLGRTWIASADDVEGNFAWPSCRRRNVLQAFDSLTTSRRAAVPTGAGRLARLRVRRDGTGSAGMVAHGFREVGRDRGKAESLEDALAWCTLGADYRGQSGAAAVVTLVSGTYKLKDRQLVWELDVGNVQADRVEADGRRFVVRPQGTTATMAGTIFWPPTAYVEYVPPEVGRGGRVRCHLAKPGPSVEEMLQESMLDKAIDLKGFTASDYDPDRDETDVELDVEFILDEPDPEVAARLQEAGKNVFNKLYKHTSSIRMGAPDRFPRAGGNCVLVLTIQDGPPPEVVVLDADHPAMLKVGGQIVRYAEYLLTFPEAP